MYNLLKKSKRIKKVRKNILRLGLPRLSIFRSNRHIYLQLISVIDGGRVLISSSSVEQSVKQEFLVHKWNKKDIAVFVGKLFVKRFKEHNFGRFVFDRSGFKFHGRVKEAVMVLREGGLCF